MKHFRLWLILFLVVVVVGAGLYGYWNLFLRWKPHVITRNQPEIVQLLERSGWVSPGLPGPTLYMISFRDCPDCERFEREIFPKLHAAGVDTRVIMVARRDTDAGLTRSSAAERTTVAELWANRNWRLWQQWHAIPSQGWTAQGLIAADNDVGRSAIVEASRKTVDDLTPLLRANGINFAYPLLVWKTREGEWHGCACERPETYRYLIRELGAEARP